ncbi:MAG: hypothetical protein ABI650_07600 [Dokdonella sp.]
MGLTILFGDRERKASNDEIAQRARDVVERVLLSSPRGDGIQPAAAPVWHSVAMQIEFHEESEYARLLSAIERTCDLQRVSVMGVHRAR